MTTFTLDTSGAVVMDSHTPTWTEVRWSDLDAFTQGYVEALFASFRAEVASHQYEPMLGRDDGWTISWLDDGVRVAGSFVWYVSVRGGEGRAMAQAKCDQANRIAYGFSDLSPEALAMILADCALRAAGLDDLDREDGALFWAERQAGKWLAFPPLTVSLGDGGKVELG